MHEINVTFPGGSKVHAHFLGFDVPTDQRKEHGGEQSAPNPFDYYFVALATCAGSTALGYCQRNQLPAEGLEVTLQTVAHDKEPRIARVIITIGLPHAFPADKIDGLRKATSNCTVTRHILTPPSFETVVVEPAVSISTN